MESVTSVHGGPRQRVGSSVGTTRAVVLVALALAVAFVLLRLILPAHGDITRFVVAGSMVTDADAAPGGLHVFDSHGYDGQFYWRQAMDPGHLDTGDHLGVRLDHPYRLQRPGYPLLAWVASMGGRPALVPWALVLVNVAAVGVIAAVGARLAAGAGRSRWWGLALAGVPGFAFALSRDLADLTGAALFIGGVLAARRGRWWLVALVWSYGVITREQLLVPIAAFALWRVVELARRRTRISPADAAWIAPAATFVALQALLRATTGQVPAMTATGNNVTIPLVGLLSGSAGWLTAMAEGPKELGTGLVTLAAMAALIGVVTAALTTRSPHLPGYERWMLIAMAVAAVSMSRVVWAAPADLRMLADLSVLAWAMVVSMSDRLRSATLRRLVAVQSVALAGAAGIRLLAI